MRIKIIASIMLSSIIHIVYAQDCHIPLYEKNVPEVLYSYEVHEFLAEDTVKAISKLNVTYNKERRKIKKEFSAEFHENSTSYCDPGTWLIEIDSAGFVITRKIYAIGSSDDVKRYTYMILDKNVYNKRGLLEQEVMYDSENIPLSYNYSESSFAKLVKKTYRDSAFSCRCKYHYNTADQLLHIENKSSYRSYINYFEYDSIGRISKTKAYTHKDTLYAIVGYDYTEDGYSTKLQYYQEENSKIVPEPGYYITSYKYVSGKLVSEMRNNEESIFYKNEYEYDQEGRLHKIRMYDAIKDKMVLTHLQKYVYK